MLQAKFYKQNLKLERQFKLGDILFLHSILLLLLGSSSSGSFSPDNL